MKTHFDLSTDGETSDEEYMQDEEAARADSDVCSDLDDDEGLKAELQMDQLSNQDPIDHADHSDHGEIDSDDDGDSKKNLVSQSRKRSIAARRVLDSDDEEEMETTENDSTTKQHEAEYKADDPLGEQAGLSSAFADNTIHSASLFEDTRDGSETTTNPAKQRDNLTKSCPIKGSKAGNRRMSMMGDLEEASMPPLMLNDSMESESDDSSSNSPVADGLPADSDATVQARPMATAVVSDDLQHAEDNRPATQPVVEEEEDKVGLGGDPDNSSLELSLLWQPSMPPPAQVRKDSSDELLGGSKVDCL